MAFKNISSIYSELLQVELLLLIIILIKVIIKPSNQNEKDTRKYEI